MPETCGLCKLCLDDSRICNGYCMFFHRRVNMMERDKNCPLVPLPEGHGRCIEADALLSVLDILKDKGCDGPVWDQMRDIVESMVTIIPAEGGGDNG